MSHQEEDMFCSLVDAVMPFGCLALRDGRNLDNIYDVTDKYEMGQVLKAKEFCELCMAKDRQTNKVFVCKKFLKKDGRKVRKAAKNEILILKMVNHPNILQLIDTFETRKEYFIIQELATGGDVFDWILDQGNYTERDASNVIKQVLEAVSYLHSLNIVHRNLKLENLMYYTENNHNKVVLRDFYLSKFENGSITEPCGTPEYLAPEVVARHRYGRPVDCWAVGVIMYILLSGNPPFYDETEEENTDLHNRIIFCRIVAGEFEFDAPYWDDISVPAKELVCRLMEVDQMLRITAADALLHKWIAGNGASEKNLKDGVCAQFEKNFAKSKWRKAIRVTTFMQRLRASETAAAEVEAGRHGEGRGEDQGEGGQSERGVGESEGGGVTPEVTVGTNPEREERNGGVGVRRWGEERGGGGRSSLSPSVGISPSTDNEPRSQPPNQSNASSKPLGDEPKKPAVKKTSGKMAAALGQTKTTTETKTPPTPIVTRDLTKPQDPVTVSDHNTAASSLPSNAKKKKPAVQAPVEEKKQDDSCWCQTQLPEAVAERPAGGGGGTGLGVVSMGVGTGIEMGGAGTFGAGSGVLGTGLGSTVRTGIGPRGDASPIGRDQRSDSHSVEFSMSRGEPKLSEGGYSYTVGSLGSSPSLGRHTTAYGQEVELGGYGGSYCSTLYGSGGGGRMYGGLGHGGVRVRGHGSSTADWQMDSVIEQIEKQMAAVLEKIEGDMPSLLEQISDCPPPPEPPRSTHTSPSSRSRSSQHQPSHSSTRTSTATPPPLPTSPRPPLPSLPHLTIPPPSYPPPSLPTRSPGQAIGEHKERDRQRGAVQSSQSPSLRPGKGL
ncbi:caM kinase-like vesicle-associated, like [Salmo trutta]|uniref:caM kinase-like vesicle-associated, like n=1 Tax=Salmo trutta TaxID=8032 RepID=UPI0011305E8D|nr:caM kinase-like vesicle-associated protein [Salmo trutta]